MSYIIWNTYQSGDLSCIELCIGWSWLRKARLEFMTLQITRNDAVLCSQINTPEVTQIKWIRYVLSSLTNPRHVYILLEKCTSMSIVWIKMAKQMLLNQHFPKLRSHKSGLSSAGETQIRLKDLLAGGISEKERFSSNRLRRKQATFNYVLSNVIRAGDENFKWV